MADEKELDLDAEFDPATEGESDGEHEFSALMPGEYVFRVIAFERVMSRSGKPQLVLRAKALRGPSKGATLLYITLTAAAKYFIAAHLKALRTGAFRLSSDNAAKERMLGKTFGATVTNTTDKGKRRDRIDGTRALTAAELDEYPDEGSANYWSKTVFSGKGDGGAKASGSGARPAAKDDGFFDEGGGTTASGKFDDSDLPF